MDEKRAVGLPSELHTCVRPHTFKNLGCKPSRMQSCSLGFLDAPLSSSACRWWNTSRGCCGGSPKHIKKPLSCTDISREQLAAIWCSWWLWRTPEEPVLCTTGLVDLKAGIGSCSLLCSATHDWATSSSSPSQSCTGRTVSLFSTIIIINNNIPRLSETAGKGSLRHPLKDTSTQLAAGNSSEHQRAWSGGGRQNYVWGRCF